MSRKFLLDKFIVQESQKNVDKATDESEKNSEIARLSREIAELKKVNEQLQNAAKPVKIVNLFEKLPDKNMSKRKDNKRYDILLTEKLQFEKEFPSKCNDQCFTNFTEEIYTKILKDELKCQKIVNLSIDTKIKMRYMFIRLVLKNPDLKNEEILMYMNKRIGENSLKTR